jgi:hypothetical protein
VEAGATAAYHCRVMQEATATPGRLRGSSRITSSHHHRHTEEIDAGNQEEVIGIGVVELGLEASDEEAPRWSSRRRENRDLGPPWPQRRARAMARVLRGYAGGRRRAPRRRQNSTGGRGEVAAGAAAPDLAGVWLQGQEAAAASQGRAGVSWGSIRERSVRARAKSCACVFSVLCWSN